MDITNKNKIIWNKTSENEPPARTQVWVCQSHGKKIRLDSWNPTKKRWKGHGGNNLDEIYWTYPIYPEVK